MSTQSLAAFARIGAPTKRNRHDRTNDHTGTLALSRVAIDHAIGRYPAGTLVSDIIADFNARLAALP